MADNPLADLATMCFACGQDNPIGLRIEFALEGEVCKATFTPGPHHVGFNDTVHGGIIFAALDDVMANFLYLKGVKAHTARCEIRYRRGLRVGETIDLESRVETERRRLVVMKGEAILSGSGKLVADATASFMLE